ncbi:SDR family oxidoreductase [Streptomyces sp. ST2-7A]|uniref:SDR family NAD(P)-dependent oxidoreductase n=1 Tax=Streptomyces sp. ST2-7A TaxID=2907214 RepID=UPI001F260BF6|nr:SDR family NAD(P)-dependent oxidoreductase [Streptomyces sp. ST2-7A]MCE7079872.1 SDR family NAD(P)-dependent oxidoreductase [Streptomyces sp. ST2-7A]
MEMDGARVLVVGATGVIGSAIAEECAARGATVLPAGRDPDRLAARARSLGAGAAFAFDAYDLDACAGLARRAAEVAGGLDAVVVAIGTVAFAPAADLGEEMVEHLFTVNALAPMAVLRGALPVVGEGGVIAAISGVLVDRPQPGMADYSAAKAALSAWLTAVRSEQRRRRVAVLDARLPHLETGFADRAAVGTPPAMPAPADLDAVVRGIVDALAEGAALVVPDGQGGVRAEARAR